MSTDLSKLCADYLRASYTSQTSEKLKASHARELVAAFFGYKSHAALIAEKAYPLEKLEEVEVFVPDIPLISQRRNNLSDLPSDLPDSFALAKSVSDYLDGEGYVGGDIWLYDTLETYVMEVLLEGEALFSDELSGVMAGLNAEFESDPYFDKAEIFDTGDSLVIVVAGTLQGSPMDDKPYNGDMIEIGARVTLRRIAGRRGFSEAEIEFGGSVNDDWRDTEAHYEVPNIRPKDQWLEMTGGFRLGETPEQFENRQREIHALRNRIAQGKAKARDTDRLASLLGTDEDDDDDFLIDEDDWS